MSKDNGFVSINISNNDTSYPPNSKLFCNLCNCNLVLVDHKKKSGGVQGVMSAIIQTKGRK